MFSLVFQNSGIAGVFAPLLVVWMMLPLIACIAFVVRFYKHKTARHSGLITMGAALPLAVPEPMIPGGSWLVLASIVLMLCPCMSIYALMIKSENRARYQEMLIQFIPIVLWIMMKDIPGPPSIS
jgi:hypothetical protein